MRKRGRVDDNHQSIIKRFRQHGATVVSLASLGKGVPDALVGVAAPGYPFGGINYLIEIKDGDKTQSRRKLTPDELKFAGDWRGPLALIETEDDVDDLMARIRKAGF